ncbi:MAG TPA: hypothetical protein VFR27_07325 [Mycobacterium sp.]|nr:hypothetical protein [Mycobacterium sp.]
MIIDANLPLYAVDVNGAHNTAAAAWLEETFGDDGRVGLPWQTIGALHVVVDLPARPAA